jgi:hypothetical protein
LEIGGLTVALEGIVKRDVDLIVLNDVLTRNPALAYHIAKEGITLFCRDHAALIDFKRRAVLGYLDTAPLRALIARTLAQRLRAGRFGMAE